jgi:hypothetical protein
MVSSPIPKTRDASLLLFPWKTKEITLSLRSIEYALAITIYMA